jgi:glycosyltransferase involved in cell wall biosynthesis
LTTPFLSICVPSRNRQRYFKQLIDALLASPRADVEFVLADNSDEPEIMDAFMASRSDARIRYLPSAERTLSMQENWERTLDATRGDWVSVIGDDDQIDPDLIDALKLAIALKPGLEAFAWSNLRYGWIIGAQRPANVRVPLAANFHDMPPWFIQRRAFGWADAGASITSGFSVYHSALSRPLLLRIKARFGGTWFGHPIVDYDSALKAAAEGRAFVYCTRPFSTFGACPESNSSALYDLGQLRQAHARFDRETGRETDRDPWLANFPFPTTLGLPSAVGQVQMWLAHSHGVEMLAGWEQNFVGALMKNCASFQNRDDFDFLATELRRILAVWKDGAHLAQFAPVYQQALAGEIFTGRNSDALYIADNIGGAHSPSAFYDVINGLLERPSEMRPELRSAGKEFELLNRLETKPAA